MRLHYLLPFLFTLSAFGDIPKECKTDRECLVDVPGTACADGTPSFYTLTKRESAGSVLIYLHGGGACWSKETCQKGMAKPLTRVETPTDWNDGPGIHDRKEAKNPFAKGYNVVTVPYCTGDVYAGNSITNYGTTDKPYVIRHQGYNNVKLILDAVKKQYPNPEKVVFVGCSAGGIGVYYHMTNLNQAFPEAKKYVVSDAGTPFKPPYLNERNYRAIMHNWGADTTLPVDGLAPKDFGSLLEYNTRKFTDIRFGFISSYRDRTMTFFALAVGSPSPFTAVKENIIDVADKNIEDSLNARVYYTDSSVHCHTPIALAGTTSLDKNLGDWLREMTEDNKGWNNVRPDKIRPVLSAFDAGETTFDAIP